MKLFEIRRTYLYVLRTYVFVPWNITVHVCQNTYVDVISNNWKQLVNEISIIFTLLELLLLHRFRLNNFYTPHAHSLTLKSNFFLSKRLEKEPWLHQPSCCQKVTITPYIYAPPSFPSHHENEPQPQCSIFPPTFWTCLPSSYSTNGQSWDIHWTTRVYPHTIPPLLVLYYIQGSLLIP